MDAGELARSVSLIKTHTYSLQKPQGKYIPYSLQKPTLCKNPLFAKTYSLQKPQGKSHHRRFNWPLTTQ